MPQSKFLVIVSVIAAVAAFVFKLLGVAFPATEFLAIMFGIWACFAAIKEAQGQ